MGWDLIRQQRTPIDFARGEGPPSRSPWLPPRPEVVTALRRAVPVAGAAVGLAAAALIWRWARGGARRRRELEAVPGHHPGEDRTTRIPDESMRTTVYGPRWPEPREPEE